MKAILTAEAVNGYIDFHKKMKIPFSLSVSTYTARIVSSYCDLHFMKSEQPKRVFLAFNMIKSDLKEKRVKPIQTEKLTYYTHSLDEKDFFSDLIFNIDIKSAYATVLLNDNLITKKTFNYLQTLPKQERLAAVGMLAGKKNIFEINQDGEIISEKTVISETADFFFYCVKKTGQIMKQAAQHLGAGYLFTWVDGIYFLENPKSARKAGEILTEFFNDNGYKVSFQELNNFEIKNKTGYFCCTYEKEGKKKLLNIPKNSTEAALKITNHLLTKSYETDKVHSTTRKNGNTELS